MVKKIKRMRRTKTVVRNNGSQQIVVLDAIVSRHHKAALGTVTRLAATTRDTPTFETTIVKAVDNAGDAGRGLLE
jgi:hypothetical protein